MPGPQFYHVHDVSFAIPVVQHKLELQTEDSYKSRFCPIYTNAVKNSLYLAPEADMEITWHGGTNVTVKYPDEWKESYLRSKRAWLRRGLNLGIMDPVEHRYRANEPFASPDGGVMAHAGGVTLVFFVGLIVKTMPGVKTMVIPPVNRFNYGWTTQSGWYDTDLYKGEFSVNLQVIVQGVPIVIRKHQPIASLLFLGDQAPIHDGVFIHAWGSRERDEAIAHSDGFYLRKTQGGLTYVQNIKQSQE